MSTPHKATPDQWHNLHQYLKLERIPDHISITLELAARVEALEREAAMNELRAASADARPAPASSLVERVAIALAESDHPHQLWHDDARAAIREVAAWLRDRGGYPREWIAQTLEQEADR
jgi:hypothetical protein